MNDLQILSFEEAVVRTVIGDDGEPRWVASDVCKAMGHHNPSQSIARLAEDDKGLCDVYTSSSGVQSMLVVNEPGLMELIMTSRTDRAKRFRRWVTHEVLPTIRKTGKYEIKPQADPILAMLESATATRLAQIELEKRQEALEIAVEAVEEQAATAKNIAESVEASYMGRTGWKTVLGFAKSQKYEISRKDLSTLGRMASKRCRDKGIERGSVDDERWDSVNSYPIPLLKEMETEFIKRSTNMKFKEDNNV